MKTFKDYLTQKNFSSITVNTYGKYILHYKEWLAQEEKQAKTINYTDLLSYLEYCYSKDLSPRYINYLLAGIRHYYEYLKELKEIENNPASDLFIKGITRRIPHDLLTEEELRTIYESYVPTKEKGLSQLVFQRNKVILGLLIFQGLSVQDLEKLEPLHLRLRKGVIEVPKSTKTNARILGLEAHQLIDLQEYESKIRPLLLEFSGKNTTALFVSIGESHKIRNSLMKFITPLKQQHSFFKEISQLRQSRITLWTKHHDIRQAQYLAGHKYVSSTERYEKTNLDDLQKELDKHHPLR
jgi:integrase/recombinase XerD